MHDIEPYWQWREYYTAEGDSNSPFFEREYNEFEFEDNVYGYLIHPQWDNIGSSTLFMKILYADYDDGFAIIELIGEWNDCLYNDIMYLKRNIIDHMLDKGINKYILIGENILNFHASDDCYYEEWFEDVEEGWISLLNFRDHLLQEFEAYGIDYYFIMGGRLTDIDWRTRNPKSLFREVSRMVTKRISLY
jgi:hypothetical protein